MNRVMPVIFGEVLFDTFPDGVKHLGGAPFNVAWHLQAFGDQPLFLSSVGNDENGDEVIHAMQQWGMSVAGVQRTAQFATGQVNVSFTAGEPAYDIAVNSAYDNITAEAVPDVSHAPLLYHGTLALRNQLSCNSLDQLLARHALPLFIDVNLRAPWYQKSEVREWLQRAYWAKLNEHELAELAPSGDTLQQQLEALQQQSEIELVVVTCGERGAIARRRDGQQWQVEPAAAITVVDTVGAGDAFTARLIHGLLHQEETGATLVAAQAFASRIVALRGAVPLSKDFYSATQA